MNWKLILLLFPLVPLVTACDNQKRKDPQTNNEISFEYIKDIKFPIDEETFFAPLVHGYSRVLEKIYIWNEFNSSIYLFDLNKLESVRKIPLELGPSTGLNQVNSIHFQSEDSIFFLDTYSERLILHIPSQGYYTTQQIVRSATDELTISSSGSRTHFHVDNHLNAYMLPKPLPNRVNRNISTSILRFNFASGDKKSIFSYPKDYLTDEAKLYSPASFTFTPDLDKILLSLAFTHEILVLDTLGNMVDRVPSESSRMTPYQGGKNHLKPPSGEWELSESFWTDIVHDPYNQLFYHVGYVSHYYRTVAGNTEKGKTLYNDSSYQVFNVFDADLEKVAEIPADFSGEIFKMIPTPIGILALWPNPLDEDHLIFRVFKVNRLVN